MGILSVFVFLLFNYRSAPMKNDAAVALHSLYVYKCLHYSMYVILKELWYKELKEQVTKI